MVVNEFYNMTVNNRNCTHYNKLGYKCNPGDVVSIKWTDMPSNYDIDFQCKKCNNIHTGKKHVLLKQKHQFVCKSCSHILGTKNNIQNLVGQKFGRLLVLELDHREQGKESYWKVQCDCGTVKIVCARSIRTNRVTSCGCYSKEITQTIRIPKLIEKNKRNIGEKHHNWNSELTNEDRERKRDVNVLKVLSRQTFERDNFICQCCNKTKTVLNAHHILPFHKYKDLRYDINNLITLCKSCHVSYHSKYKKDINLKTLNEYKKEVNFVL
jgi:5-methylcytosine-specific restriction endonuclease McrA